MTDIATSTSLKIEAICIDGNTQSRSELNYDVIHDYAASMLQGDVFHPVTVFYDGSSYWLADGFHRYHAARQICREEIEAEIRQGSRRDAVLFSVGANATHGLRRTNEDKRKAVETLLNDQEWAMWSDYEIARKTGTSQPFVWNIRRVTNNIISDERSYLTKHGTIATMNTSNIGQRPQELQQETISINQFFGEIAPGFTEWQQARETPAIVPSVDDEVEEDEQEETEEDRYHLAVDTGTTEYYHADLRREVFQRDREEREQPVPTNDVAKEKRDAHVMDVMGSSDSPEWYTPTSIIDYTLRLFGEIDLDPCSNSHETPNVLAKTCYTKEDDGLAQIWSGKVYLNPPYGSEIGKWINKLVASYEHGDVEESISLLPARIDTIWFQPLYSYLMCNVRGRIQFANSPYSAPFPCVVVYMGKRTDAFVEVFKSLGPVMRRVG